MGTYRGVRIPKCITLVVLHQVRARILEEEESRRDWVFTCIVIKYLSIRGAIATATWGNFLEKLGINNRGSGFSGPNLPEWFKHTGTRWQNRVWLLDELIEVLLRSYDDNQK